MRDSPRDAAITEHSLRPIDCTYRDFRFVSIASAAGHFLRISGLPQGEYAKTVCQEIRPCEGEAREGKDDGRVQNDGVKNASKGCRPIWQFGRSYGGRVFETGTGTPIFLQ